MSVPKTSPDVSEDAPLDNAHEARPLSRSENIVLTIKVLAVMGLLGVALWAINLWTVAK